MINLYIDFEYIESNDKTHRHLICCSIHNFKSNETFSFDLRDETEKLKEWLLLIDVKVYRFVGFAISNAEIPCLCQIMGSSWVLETKWWDLWVEFKMLALTHSKYFSSSTSLSSCLRIFSIEDQYEADKEVMRDLILYNEIERKKAEKLRKNRIETNSFNYSKEEMEKIQFYCENDTKILPKILIEICKVYEKYDVQQTEIDNRGEHCKCAGISFFAHRGYPVDAPRVKTIFENREHIKRALQLNCNEQTGLELYQPQYKGPQKSKHLSHYQFNMRNFEKYLELKNLLKDWKRTEKGRLSLDEDYLDEMLSKYKEILSPLYHTRNTLKQLNSTDLSSLLTSDGYIKSVSWPFHQKTSRTSPKPKLGFMLNLTPWLRMLIHPKPGRAFVSIDYKSQEVLIAATLSNDEQMLEDYLTEIYLGQAIKTGFAPVGATKQTHRDLRDHFKPITLGTQFGMQAESLSVHFYNLFKSQGQVKSPRECISAAEKFLADLKAVYWRYYQFLDKHYRQSRNKGYYKSIDGWYYFVDRNTRPTQLINVPCQTGGAAITRLAQNKCIYSGIPVITLHDALSFECAESSAQTLAAKVSQLMCDASKELLGNDYMQTETKIYTHTSPYYDKRGEQIYRFVMNELKLDCPEKFNKPKEILNIHKLV